MSGLAEVALALACLAAAIGIGCCCAWARLKWRASRAGRPRRTKPMRLAAILAEFDADVAEARTQALDRL